MVACVTHTRSTRQVADLHIHPRAAWAGVHLASRLRVDHLRTLQGLAQIDTLLTNSPLNLLISAVTAVLVISVSTKLILSVRDSICDVRRLLRLQRMRNSESWPEVETLIADIGPMLDEGH